MILIIGHWPQLDIAIKVFGLVVVVGPQDGFGMLSETFMKPQVGAIALSDI